MLHCVKFESNVMTNIGGMNDGVSDPTNVDPYLLLVDFRFYKNLINNLFNLHLYGRRIVKLVSDVLNRWILRANYSPFK